jgi:hypothetical protein
MFVRTKIAKGHTYYQIVEGFREGDRVRQRVVVALGRGVPVRRFVGLKSDGNVHLRKTAEERPPTLEYALFAMKSELRSLRHRRNYKAMPRGYVSTSKTLNRQNERLDRQIDELTARAETLADIIKKGLVVPTNKKK